METTIKIIRLEDKGNEIFVHAEYNDPEIGIFHYAKWLDDSDIATYRADNNSIKDIMGYYTATAKNLKLQETSNN